MEQDGQRWRWVLLFGDRRMAKGGQWWNSEDEASDAADEFLEALRHMGDA